jgi:tripartite ATP-independent transporter DctM subunit
MDVTTITILLFSFLIILLVTGLPIAFAMAGVAVVFTYFLWGLQGLMMISANTFGVMRNFILTAIPLFIFMGIILQHSGLAGALYDMMYKWLGPIRGGLAIGTVIVCMLFAAMTGVSGAATVSMGLIALPSMFKYKYDKRIAIGCISAGGALGILIPPSVLMIVYGVFTGESIGALYAGGLMPGVLLGFLYVLYITIRCFFQPQLGPSIPKDERVSWKEKFISLKSVILPVILIIVVLGMIIKGISTPTEAAAIGAIGSLICAAISRKLTWNIFKTASYDTLKLSCMILWIIIGGTCFSSLYTAVGAVDLIQEAVSSLPLSRYVILAGMQIILIILGCLMDPGGIIMICAPIMVPVIKALGFDSVWFGVLFIINMEMAYLTPPLGFNLFYMKAIVPKSITMGDIYKSITPFVGLQALALVICIIFPEIIVWLPQSLIK